MKRATAPMATKRWLWVLVAPTFVFYTIATSRGADVLRRLLGSTFAGVLGSDRLPTYLTYAAGGRQFCWAHFTRNLLSAQELAKTASATRFCREALALQRQLFRLWHRFHGDPHPRRASLQEAPKLLLDEAGQAFPVAQTRGLHAEGLEVIVHDLVERALRGTPRFVGRRGRGHSRPESGRRASDRSGESGRNR